MFDSPTRWVPKRGNLARLFAFLIGFWFRLKFPSVKVGRPVKRYGRTAGIAQRLVHRPSYGLTHRNGLDMMGECIRHASEAQRVHQAEDVGSIPITRSTFVRKNEFL